MLLPGPEAMQLATYAGWKLHGTRGGLAAGLLFVLPGALVVLALTMLYAAFGKLPLVEAALLRHQGGGAGHRHRGAAARGPACTQPRAPTGSSPASPSWRSSLRPALPARHHRGRALYGFLRGSGVARGACGRACRSWRALLRHGDALGRGLAGAARRCWHCLLGPHHVLTEVGVFFSKLAVVTFGGAYAVLSYMAQAAVETQGLALSATEMIDGLALAETTPGPLILVTQFVGYFAGYRDMGCIWGGIAGAAVTLWMTFAPCFLWIFAGAPYIEAIGKRPRLSGALAAITAAVVGVILNLSLWFGLHVLFGRWSAATDGSGPGFRTGPASTGSRWR